MNKRTQKFDHNCLQALFASPSKSFNIFHNHIIDSRNMIATKDVSVLIYISTAGFYVKNGIQTILENITGKRKKSC